MLPAEPRLLAQDLVQWFAHSHRDLPWRHDRTGYRVWLSEIMLQQTQVAVVEDYYRRFLERFPTVEALAAASEDDVLALWSGLGYYSRGRNLHRAAQQIVDTHRGAFPRTAAQLRTLPGVGPYTAAAIASLAFGESEAVVDGNVARVLSRLCDDDTPVDSPEGKTRLAARAHALVIAAPHSGPVNEGLMELGALVCTPKVPRCAQCPWRDVCAGRAAGRAAELPKKKPSRARQQLAVASVILHHGSQVWLERRTSSGLFGGMYQPPSAVLSQAGAPAADVNAAWQDLLLERDVQVPTHFPAAVRVQRTLTHRDLTFFALPLHVSAAVLKRLAQRADAGGPHGAQVVGRLVDLTSGHEVGVSAAVRALLAAALPRQSALFS